MPLPEFNSCLDIVEDFKDLPLQRQNDAYLMLTFEENRCNKGDLKLLNFVWKHLHVFTLTDIATVNGKKISHQLMEVIKSNHI